jgi:hypothetical protein
MKPKSKICDGHSVLVSGAHLGLITRFFLLSDSCCFLCCAPSLTRGRVCSLQLLLGPASAVFLKVESDCLTTDVQSASLSCCQATICSSWSVFLELSWRSVDQLILVSGSPLESMTIFYPYPFFSDNCFVLPVGRPLWREDGSVSYSAIANWSSHRTNNHVLTFHLRLDSLFVASYDSQGLRWRYSNPPPQGASKTVEVNLQPTVSRPVCLGIGPPYGTLDKILSCSSFFCWQLLQFSWYSLYSYLTSVRTSQKTPLSTIIPLLPIT